MCPIILDDGCLIWGSAKVIWRQILDEGKNEDMAGNVQLTAHRQTYKFHFQRRKIRELPAKNMTKVEETVQNIQMMRCFGGLPYPYDPQFQLF